MSDEINFNEQQRLKEQSQQKTKKQKKTKKVSGGFPLWLYSLFCSFS